jgi:transcriptional regulator with XRE-family HTH domain
MTPTQYIRLRKQLGLSNYALAPALGVSLRQAQRYESGGAPIPETVAKLLKLYAKYGYDIFSRYGDEIVPQPKPRKSDIPFIPGPQIEHKAEIE